MNEKALDYLLQSQHPEGGWAYNPGTEPVVEATCAVLLALSPILHGGSTTEQARDAAQHALQWLLAQQHADGGWGMSAQDQISGWHTSWAALALTYSGTGAGVDALARARQWLLAEPVIRVVDNEMMKSASQVLKIDPSIAGWPWGAGEGSWVEPTSLAMLALAGTAEQAEVRTRLDEATRYLSDRRCPGGGWNVGNPVMFDGSLPPRAAPTALSLLALHSYAPQTIQPDDVAALQADLPRDGGVIGLGLGLLALNTLGHAAEQAHEMLLRLQAGDGSWRGSPFQTALAVLGLEGAL